MKVTLHTCLLLLTGLSLVFAGGCSSQSKKNVWKPVWEVPDEVYYYAMGREIENSKMKLMRAEPLRHVDVTKRYEGVIPRVFKDEKGNYRICWIKKDPLRASYWYDMYEFSSDGMFMKSAMSSIPSSLTEPDHTKIPGW